MGLLDDAIREHLELKRRHGADPDEVSRQEREALGAPVRGEFAKPAGEAGEAPADAARGTGARRAGGSGHRGRRRPGDRRAARDAGRARAGARSARPADGRARAGTEEDPWLVEDLADPEPEPEPEPARARAGPGPEPERPAARAAGAEPPEGEDVLEETPEFLQETPEHDRLWFEQKPPRDFDWDK